MATQTEDAGKIVASWLSVELAAELKRHAEEQRRSVSSVIRGAVEDAVRPAEVTANASEHGDPSSSKPQESPPSHHHGRWSSNVADTRELLPQRGGFEGCYRRLCSRSCHRARSRSRRSSLCRKAVTAPTKALRACRSSCSCASKLRMRFVLLRNIRLGALLSSGRVGRFWIPPVETEPPIHPRPSQGWGGLRYPKAGSGDRRSAAAQGGHCPAHRMLRRQPRRALPSVPVTVGTFLPDPLDAAPEMATVHLEASFFRGVETEPSHLTKESQARGGLMRLGPDRDDRRVMPELLPQPGGFEGCGLIHVRLDPYHPSLPHGEDNRSVGLDFDATAPAAPVLVHEHDDKIVDVKEPLRVELTLFPSFEVLSLKRVEHLRKTASDPALPKATDRPVHFNVRIEQFCRSLPVPSHGGSGRRRPARRAVDHFEGIPHDLYVLLRHRPRSISPAGV